MKKQKPFTYNREQELAHLASVRDEDIDFSDIPEVTSLDGWVRGMFYRPIKQSATIRFDADILAWFKANHPKYQTAMNAALREYISQQKK